MNKDNEQEQKSILVIKIIALVTNFLVSMIFGLIPIYSSKIKGNVKVVGLANAFSSGIFITIAFLDLIPESSKMFDEYYQRNKIRRFPTSYLIVILSYSLVMIIDKVIFNNSNEQSSQDPDNIEMDHIRQDDQSLDSKQPKDKQESVIRYIPKRFRSLDQIDQQFNLPQLQNLDQLQQPLNSSVNSNTKKPICSYVLLIALSFHGFFEGSAIGIQSHLIDLFNISLAVGLHKWAEAFTLGNSFNRSNFSKQQAFKAIFIFSIICPIGIIFGMILNQTNELVKATFFSISAGTFLYISTTELIVEEFSTSENKYLKLLFYFLGIGLFILLGLLENE